MNQDIYIGIAIGISVTLTVCHLLSIRDHRDWVKLIDKSIAINTRANILINKLMNAGCGGTPPSNIRIRDGQTKKPKEDD